MGIIIATFIVVVVIASALSQHLAIFSWDYWLEGGNALRSEVVRNLGLLAAAVIGVVVGSWRAVMGYMHARAAQRQAEAASEQARIAERGHITERFSRAVEQLGHDRVAVRIGGLYALKRIAEDSVERDHLAVMDVFTNFIRQPPYAAAQREATEREITWRPFRTKSAEEKADSDRDAVADQIADGAAPPPEPELIDCPDIAATIEIIQGGLKTKRRSRKSGSTGFRCLAPASATSDCRILISTLSISPLRTSWAPTSLAPTLRAPTSWAPTSRAPTSWAPRSGTPTSRPLSSRAPRS